MGAYVLLNLLNKLGKGNKMQGLPMLDSIYHISSKLIKNHIFGVITLKFCNLLRNVIMDLIT